MAAVEKVRRYVGRMSDGLGPRAQGAPGDDESGAPARNFETAFISVRVDGVTERIEVGSIEYIEAWGNYVKIHMGGQTLVERRTLSDLEVALSEHGFVRIHKAWVVRLRAIDAIDGNRVRIGGQYLPIGAIYKQKLRDLIASDSL